MQNRYSTRQRQTHFIEDDHVSHISNRSARYVQIQQALQKGRKIKIWTLEEDKLLTQQHNLHNNAWNTIAEAFPGRNANQCCQRWRRIRPDQNKIRNQWTVEEDRLVKRLVKKYGKNWNQIARDLPNRTGKQIRERFINNLDDEINHQPWTEEEDKKLLDIYNKHGNKWSEISKVLKGRPENMVKNRFYSFIKRVYLPKNQDETSISQKNYHSDQLQSQSSYDMELEEEEYEKYINVEPEKPKLSTIKSEFQEENVKSSINTFHENQIADFYSPNQGNFLWNAVNNNDNQPIPIRNMINETSSIPQNYNDPSPLKALYKKQSSQNNLPNDQGNQGNKITDIEQNFKKLAL